MSRNRIAPLTIASVALALGVVSSAIADDIVASGDSAAGVQYVPETTRTTEIVPPPPTQTTPTPPPPPAETTPVPPPPAVAPVVTTPTETTPTVPSKSPPPTERPVVEKAPPEQPAEQPAPKPVAQAPAAAPTAAQEAAPAAGGLPFTGYDVIPVALGGLALVALGLILRRQSRPHS